MAAADRADQFEILLAGEVGREIGRVDGVAELAFGVLGDGCEIDAGVQDGAFHDRELATTTDQSDARSVSAI
jgi:hypothetical protein